MQHEAKGKSPTYNVIGKPEAETVQWNSSVGWAVRTTAAGYEENSPSGTAHPTTTIW